MSIRLANPSDLDALYALSKDGLSKSVYSNIEPNEIEARQILAGLIVSGSAWVTENVDGALVACLQSLWFNNSVLIASDLFFYVQDSAVSDGVKLVKEYKKWGKENADKVSLSITFGGDISRTEKFYELIGFEKIGGSYLLRG